MFQAAQVTLPTLLDLYAVDAASRARTWSSSALQVFPGLAFDQLPAKPTPGVFKHLSLGTGSLSYIQSPPAKLHYAPPEPADRCPESAFTMAVQLSGELLASQHGCQCRIGAGGVFTMDERFAFRLESAAPCELVLVRMPRQAVLAQHPHLKNHTATALSAGTPGTALLREVVINILQAASCLTSEQRTAAVATIIQLMGMADFEPAASSSSQGYARIRTALSFVELSLFESGLTASAVAAAQGMSRRRLDSLFLSAVGMTVSTHIWNRRLALAASFLTDARRSDQTIAQIAHAVGFADPAHFARMFKRHFGCPPRQWRQKRESPAPAGRRGPAAGYPLRS